jgi:AraC family transcriptional activator of mar-sox-rob regulon
LLEDLRQVRFLGQDLAASLTGQLLVNHCRALLSGERPLADEGSRRIAAVCARIAEDPAAHVDLTTTARKAGMSRTAFVNRFRKHAGMTLIEYVLSVRMNRAMELLAQSDRTIADIALDCGFGNLGYFHRCFQRHCRMTPRAFRLRVRDQGRTPAAIRALKTRHTG